MDTKSSEAKTVGIFLAITSVAFLFIAFGLPFLWNWIWGPAASTDIVAVIESLATAIAAAAVFGGGYIAYRELSEGAKSRHLAIADRLFDELNSPENIEARRRIYALRADPAKGVSNLGARDRAAIKQVLNSLDRVAFLTQQGWIPDEMIMPWMHPMIAKSWKVLEPYVMYERKARNEPYYYRYAEGVAARCAKWRAENNIDENINWTKKAL